MISDREYMKDGGYRAPLSWTAKLTIALIVAFAMQCINDVYVRWPVEHYLALTFPGLKKGFLWQVVTFQFLHAGLLHITFNLIAFWWLGRFAEQALGVRRFLLLFFGAGAIGGAIQGCLMLLWPMQFGMLTYGASAGVSGLLAFFAMVEPDSEVRFNFLLPIPARMLLWISLGISFFFTLVPVREGVAHAAHLGGLLAGIGFVRLGWHRDWVELPWEGWWDRVRQGWRERRSARSARSGSGGRGRVPRLTLVPEEKGARAPGSEARGGRGGGGDFVALEVDPILEKLHAHGWSSLTEKEKETLAMAGKKLGPQNGK